jgi:hypothetical protein
MVRGVLSLMVVAACGRIDFDPLEPPGPNSDAPIAGAPAIVANAAANAKTSELTYPLAIPPGDNRYLLVSLNVGNNCLADLPATVGVTYGTASLTRISELTGTPCGATSARTELWHMVAPPEGTADVVITLAAVGESLHSGALAFTGISPTAPVRESNSTTDQGLEAALSIDSKAGDLVVTTIGQGTGITAPGSREQEVYIRNVSAATTCDNTGASVAPADDPTTTATWTFSGFDQWQMLGVSLQPAS